MQTNFFVRPEFNQVTPRFGNFMNDFNYYYAPVATSNFTSPINVFDQNMLHFGHFINDPKSRFQSRPTYFPNNWMKDFNSYNRCGFDVFPQLSQTQPNLAISPDRNASKNLMKALSQSDASIASTQCKNEPISVESGGVGTAGAVSLNTTTTASLISSKLSSLCSTANKIEKTICNVSKPFLCNLCSASFSRHHHLRRHERSHLNTRPYRCTLCTSSFNDSWHLKRHQYTHTNEKPYQCSLCTSAFKDSWHLKRHQQIHTKIKPFQCNECKSSFYDSWHLKRHHLQVHVKVKPYSCNSCSSKFYDSWHLKRHQQVHLRKKVIQQNCTTTPNFEVSRNSFVS